MYHPQLSPPSTDVMDYAHLLPPGFGRFLVQHELTGQPFDVLLETLSQKKYASLLEPEDIDAIERIHRILEVYECDLQTHPDNLSIEEYLRRQTKLPDSLREEISKNLSKIFHCTRLSDIYIVGPEGLRVEGPTSEAIDYAYRLHVQSMNDLFEDLFVDMGREDAGDEGTDAYYTEREVPRGHGCLSMAVVAAIAGILSAGIAHELSSERKWLDYENLRASLKEVTAPVVQKLDRLLGDTL